MDYKEFVKETVLNYDTDSFNSVKDVLLEDYLLFSIVSKDEITKKVLAEKLCDYFEKLELKTGRTFDRQIDIYTDNLDDIVERRLTWTSKPKKGDDTPIEEPRTRKFYNKIKYIKDAKDVSMEQLIDYSRIMLCLYMSIINNNYKHITDFNYEKDFLDLNAIIASMKREKEQNPLSISKSKKVKFDLKEPYSSDTCTFILVIVLIHKILQD